MLGAWWTICNGFQHKTSTKTWAITLALLGHWHSQRTIIKCTRFCQHHIHMYNINIYMVFIYLFIVLCTKFITLLNIHSYTRIYIFPQYYPTQFTIFNRLAQLFQAVLYTGLNISNDVNFVVLSHLWNVFLALILVMILFINSNCKLIVRNNLYM